MKNGSIGSRRARQRPGGGRDVRPSRSSSGSCAWSKIR